MDPARQDDERDARERPGDEGPGVADDGRGRKARDLRVGNLDAIFEFGLDVIFAAMAKAADAAAVVPVKRTGSSRPSQASKPRKR